jgi:hypothetical protein
MKCLKEKCLRDEMKIGRIEETVKIEFFIYPE